MISEIAVDKNEKDRRLSIDKHINDSVIPAIDETKILGLDKGASERIELFLFAMALGVRLGKRTPLKVQHGFIRETSIKGLMGAMSTIYSLLVNEVKNTSDEDKIDDKNLAFKVAEEYANTGFIEIEKWIPTIATKDDAINLMWKCIGEMDEKYENIIQIKGRPID